eukprot:461381-Pleurochrysis_carterae.AAC.1
MRGCEAKRNEETILTRKLKRTRRIKPRSREQTGAQEAALPRKRGRGALRRRLALSSPSASGSCSDVDLGVAPSACLRLPKNGDLLRTRRQRGGCA